MGTIRQKFQENKVKWGTRWPIFVLANNLPFSITVKTAPPDLEHPVYVRTKTTDITTFIHVILDKEYALSFNASPKVILDCGANIGLTSVYYANLYPNATIIAVEPVESNYNILIKNVSYYENIIPVHGAIWDKKIKLSIEDAGTGHWGFQTRESGDFDIQVQAYSINDILKEYGFNSISLLKMDIEGAEKEVFESASDWIEKVDVVIVELHDRLKAGCETAFQKATNEMPVKFVRGENHIAARKGLINVSSDIQS